VSNPGSAQPPTWVDKNNKHWSGLT